jgi:serine/threonine-protein kinase
MLDAGDIVDGRFQVEALVGEGGLAQVYRVRHTALGSVHALKLLSWRKKSLAERLILEGRIQAQLSHPNIVAVTDLVRHDGQLGLLMEYVDNRSLEDHLNESGGFGLETGLELFAPILSAVTAAHDAGVTHRDLKPANVLLAQSARGVVPKVTDFGIAKVVAEVAGGSTAVGATMGTPGYLAPEQVRDSSTIDQRADIFALGAILYEVITGYRAFADEKGALTVGSTTNVTPKPLVTWLKETPEHIQQAVDKALNKDPGARYPDCRAFARDLYREHPRLLAMVEGQMPTGTLSLSTTGSSFAASPKQVHSHPTLQPAPSSGMTGPATGEGGNSMWLALGVAFVGAVVLAIGLGLVVAVMGNSMLTEDADTVAVDPEPTPEPTPSPPEPTPPTPEPATDPDGSDDPDSLEDPEPDTPEPTEAPEPDGSDAVVDADPPEPSPVADPSPATEPSPAPTVTAAAQPTPAPAPDPAPAVEPEPTPDPAVEPEPALDPAVEPAPAVEPEPAPAPEPEPEPVAQPDPEPAPDPEPVAVPPELGGTWKGKAANRPFRLVIEPGTTTGRVQGEAVFPAATASRSETLSGTVNADGVVRLQAAEFTFTGRLTGNRLSGTYVASGSSRYLDWSVTR